MMPAPGIEPRVKVLIAAAAVAALGENIRILEIRPVAETKPKAWKLLPQMNMRPKTRRRVVRRAITNHA